MYSRMCMQSLPSPSWEGILAVQRCDYITHVARVIVASAGGMDGIELLARANSHDSERTKLLKQASRQLVVRARCL